MMVEMGLMFFGLPLVALTGATWNVDWWERLWD